MGNAIKGMKPGKYCYDTASYFHLRKVTNINKIADEIFSDTWIFFVPEMGAYFQGSKTVSNQTLPLLKIFFNHIILLLIFIRTLGAEKKQ